MPSPWFFPQVSYNAALDACSKAGRADKALELLRDMQLNDIEPGVMSFNCVLDACANVSWVFRCRRGGGGVRGPALFLECPVGRAWQMPNT